MVAAGGSLRERLAAELGAEDDERVFHQSAGSSGRVSRAAMGRSTLRGHRRQLVGDVVVVVPVVAGSAGAAPDLHESDSALEQPAREQTAAAEVGRGGIFQSIKCPRRRGFTRPGRGPRGACCIRAASS